MTVAAPPPAKSAVETVLAMTDDEQEAVFVALVKKLIDVNGAHGLIPIRTQTEQLGYYVPPAAADAIAKARGPQLTPEELAELQRRIDNPGKTIGWDEMMTIMREADLNEDR